jgi:hypothetical protein
MLDNDTNNDQVSIEEADGNEANLTSIKSAGKGNGSRSETLASMIQNMTKLSDGDLNGFKSMLDQIGKEADGVPGSAAANNARSVKSTAAAVKQVVKEDLKNLFEGETSLSESFVDQATTLFEAAISSRVGLEIVRIEEEAESQLAEQTETMVKEFAERLDTYLDYVAEQFIDENRLAIESGIKTELTESFIANLRDLFVEHAIEVPESSVDIVEELVAENEELKERLNDQINENIAITTSLENEQLGSIVNEAVEGLTEADADRFRALAEELDYDDAADFTSKLTVIRESLFGDKKVGSSNGLMIEEVGIVEDANIVPLVENASAPASAMDMYVKAIKTDVKNKPVL